jgi:RNA polymerase sigma-70 factor, ECF subfamily
MTISDLTPDAFETLLQDMRPELHRYATRMTGSVFDGEDVVQEALVKAYASFSLLTHSTNIRGWLFRITHNKAIDLLRRDSDPPMPLLDESLMAAAPDQPLEEKELAALALSMFLKLAPRQRSCVILKDVMGYSLTEVSEFLDATVPEIKATLHRGRTRLRELAASSDGAGPGLDAREQDLLARYVDRFNARDFETLRTMLADEVRLDLIGRAKGDGISAVADHYFQRYKQTNDCRLAVGMVEDRPAMLAYDLNETTQQPAYVILLTWNNNQVSLIRDYRYARYVIQEARISIT